MAAPMHLLLAALLLAAAPQTAAVKWGLWKTQPGKLEMVRTYDSKAACMAAARELQGAQDGWRYYCRIS